MSRRAASWAITATEATASTAYWSRSARDHQRRTHPAVSRTSVHTPRTASVSGRCIATRCAQGEVEPAEVAGIDESGHPHEQGRVCDRQHRREERRQCGDPAPALRRGGLLVGTQAHPVATYLASCGGDEPCSCKEGGGRENAPLPPGGTACYSNEPETLPPRDGAAQVECLAVVREEQSGCDFDELVADERTRLVDLPVRDAPIDDEPAARTGRGDQAPRGCPIGTDVARPAGRLIARPRHGGVGDQVCHLDRGLEPARIDHRWPRWQRQQSIAIYARLCHQITEDRQREISLELVIFGIGQDRDADPKLRQPPQVGEESEATAAMGEEIRPFVPAIPLCADDAERVARRCAGSRCRDRAHLLHRLRIEDSATADRAVVQLEAEEAGQVGGAGVQHRDRARCCYPAGPRG
jgi:hypothetical protein